MKLSWITIVAAALGLAALTVAALVPAVMVPGNIVGSFLIGVAIPHGVSNGKDEKGLDS